MSTKSPPPVNRGARLLLPFLAAGLASCALLQPKQTTPNSGGNSQPRMVKQLCELDEDAERLVFMPYGSYSAAADSHSGELQLKDDQTFFLRYTNRYTGQESQWNGRFEWKKQGIGEVLNFCDVRKATEARMEDGTSTVSTAVFNFSTQEHFFEVNIDGVGSMHFKKKGA